MHILRQAVLAVALVALSGCSYFFGDEGQFRERSLDYQNAKSIEPLTIPEGLESKSTKQRYPIPDVVVTSNAFEPTDSNSVPRPRTLANLDQDAGLELRKDKELYWLVADRDLSTLWPQLIAFVESNSFTVEVNDQASGLIETGWLKPRLEGKKGFWKSFLGFFTWGNSEDARDKFRIQVSKSPRESGNVVTINHVREESPLPTSINWPISPDDTELVRVVYEELMEYLSDDSRRQGTSVLSQDLKSVPKYTMTRDGNDYPVLVINLDFNHAWLEVGQALALSKIEVKDLNRSLGIYYLARTVVVKDEDGDDETKELQLRVIRSESGIQVAVQLDDDTIAPKTESTEILNALREKLQ